MPSVRLIETDLPIFGEPTVQPVISGATYAARMQAAVARAKAEGMDALVVYGDREHSANIAYLTGYDPRFEEALLVAPTGAWPRIAPHLFVGNEGWSYAELAQGSFERVLCQSFSLPGQPRDRQKPLVRLLAEAGIKGGMTVGAVGWKSFGPVIPGRMRAGSTCRSSLRGRCARWRAGPGGWSMRPTCSSTRPMGCG